MLPLDVRQALSLALALLLLVLAAALALPGRASPPSPRRPRTGARPTPPPRAISRARPAAPPLVVAVPLHRRTPRVPVQVYNFHLVVVGHELHLGVVVVVRARRHHVHRRLLLLHHRVDVRAVEAVDLTVLQVALAGERQLLQHGRQLLLERLLLQPHLRQLGLLLLLLLQLLQVLQLAQHIRVVQQMGDVAVVQRRRLRLPRRLVLIVVLVLVVVVVQQLLVELDGILHRVAARARHWLRVGLTHQELLQLLQLPNGR